MDEASVREGLATLFLWWYGNHPAIRDVLRDGFSSRPEAPLSARPYSSNSTSSRTTLQELPVRSLEDAWRTRWFAKGDLTEIVDLTMRQQFAWLLEDESARKALLANSTTATDRQQHSSSCLCLLWRKIALILLFDQVTRNIYRGTPLAYSGDAIALPLAMELADEESKIFERLPFHFQATVCICLCHAEDARVQSVLKDRVAKLVERQDYEKGANNHRCLVAALQEIQKKHEERIALFGRFPERNEILGRASTQQEAAYLEQMR